MLWSGVAKPVCEMRRAEARVVVGGEALIVQLCAEVFGMGVCGHLPWVSRRAQETPDEFIHTDRLGAGYFNRAIDRLPDGNVGQPLMGPGNWLVFGRYARPRLAARGESPAAIFVARLVG